MLVDLDWVANVKKRFSQINAQDIEDIRWVKDGIEVGFSEENLKAFAFMGLNNTDLPTMFKPEPPEGSE